MLTNNQVFELHKVLCSMYDEFFSFTDDEFESAFPEEVLPETQTRSDRSVREQSATSPVSVPPKGEAFFWSAKALLQLNPIYESAGAVV